MSETPTENSILRLPWIKSPKGIFEVYANEVHLTWSLTDIRIRLGQIVDSPATPNPGRDFVGATEERAALTLSWRTAKILRDHLDTVIDAWEKTNGPINVDVKLPDSIP